MGKELDPYLTLAILRLAERLSPDAVRPQQDVPSIGPQGPAAAPSIATKKPMPARAATLAIAEATSMGEAGVEHEHPGTGGSWPIAGSVSIVRGYTVRTLTKTVSPEEAERRRGLVAGVIARSIRPRPNTD